MGAYNFKDPQIHYLKYILTFVKKTKGMIDEHKIHWISFLKLGLYSILNFRVFWDISVKKIIFLQRK